MARQAIVPTFGPVSSESHGQRIVAVTGCFTAFASLVVLARLYVRSVMLKTMGIGELLEEQIFPFVDCDMWILDLSPEQKPRTIQTD